MQKSNKLSSHPQSRTAGHKTQQDLANQYPTVHDLQRNIQHENSHLNSQDLSNEKVSHNFNQSQRTDFAKIKSNIQYQQNGNLLSMSRKQSDFSFASGSKGASTHAHLFSPSSNRDAGPTAVAAYSAILANEEVGRPTSLIQHNSSSKSRAAQLGAHNMAFTQTHTKQSSVNLNQSSRQASADMSSKVHPQIISQSARNNSNHGRSKDPSHNFVNIVDTATSRHGPDSLNSGSGHKVYPFVSQQECYRIDEESDRSSTNFQRPPLSSRQHHVSRQNAKHLVVYSDDKSHERVMSGGLNSITDDNVLSMMRHLPLTPKEQQDRNYLMPVQRTEKTASNMTNQQYKAHTNSVESQFSHVQATIQQLRLDNANKYAELCERRILELQPNHELPVTEEHLGTGNPFIEELRNGGFGESPRTESQSRSPRSQSADQTRQQQDDQVLTQRGSTSPRTVAIQKHLNTLKGKNSLLEKALRSETLVNEEQRTYIQILQNVIEQKLERDGILELLKEAIQKRKANERLTLIQRQNMSIQTLSDKSKHQMQSLEKEDDPINLYIVLADLKAQLEAKDRENMKLQDQNRLQDGQIQALLQENSNLLKSHNHMPQDRNSQTNDLNSLYKQKEDLLDCVELQIQQIEQLKQELFAEKKRSQESATRLALLQQSAQLHQSEPRSEQTASQNQNAHQMIGNQAIYDDEGVDVNSQSELVELSYSHAGNSTVNQTMLNQTRKHSNPVQRELANDQQSDCQLKQSQQNNLQNHLTQQYSEQSNPHSNNQEQHGLVEILNYHQQQEIGRLRTQLSLVSEDLYSAQAQLEKARLQNTLLRNQMEMESSGVGLSRKLQGSQPPLEEQNRLGDIQAEYDQKIRLMQRELTCIKEQKIERDTAYEQLAKMLERQVKENALKETQNEGLKTQTQRDSAKIRDLKHQIEDNEVELQRLRKDKESKEQATLLETQSKENLCKEKHELVQALNDAHHQLELLKTTSQTQQSQAVGKQRDAEGRVEFLEKETKKQIKENETIQRDLTQLQIKLKQTEVQLSYLEKSNEQLTAEYRQTRLELDAEIREKKKLQTQISDLQQENEQLYRNEERQRRLTDQISTLQCDLKGKELEIEKLDTKLRKQFIAKDEYELELTNLRKQLSQFQMDKTTLHTQKESLTAQSTDLERRLFEMTKMSQDNDRKIRENGILIKDLQTERDKYKSVSLQKEQEIVELDSQIRVLRNTNTDLKLIEEKLDLFLEELTNEIEAHKRQIRKQLQAFLELVDHSQALSDLIPIKQRELGREHLDELQPGRPFSTNAHLAVNADSQDQTNLGKTGQSHIWQALLKVKQNVGMLKAVSEWNGEMLEICVAQSIDLKGDLTRKSRQVTNLETRLGSIHSVDFKQQEECSSLRKEVLDLKSALSKAMADTQSLQTKLQKQSQHIADLEKQKSNLEFQLSNSVKKSELESKEKYEHKYEVALKDLNRVICENVKMQDLIARVMNCICRNEKDKLRGVFDEMQECAMSLAQFEHEKDELVMEITKATQEVKGVAGTQKLYQQQSATSFGTLPVICGNTHNTSLQEPSANETVQQDSIHLIKRVKSLKANIGQKDEQVKEIQDRIECIFQKFKLMEVEFSRLFSEMYIQKNDNAVNIYKRDREEKTGAGKSYRTNASGSYSPPNKETIASLRTQTNEKQSNEGVGQYRLMSGTQNSVFTSKLRNQDKEMLDDHPIKESSKESDSINDMKATTGFIGETFSKQEQTPMTYSIETLLKETRDLRSKLCKRNEYIKNLESDLQKINTYSVMRFDDTEQSCVPIQKSNYVGASNYRENNSSDVKFARKHNGGTTQDVMIGVGYLDTNKRYTLPHSPNTDQMFSHPPCKEYPSNINNQRTHQQLTSHPY